MRASGASGPARRAVLRWGWRLFRRDWRQQVQLLALVTIAVSGAVAASVMAINGVTPTAAQTGSGGAMTTVELASPEAAAPVIAEARRRFGTIDVIRHRRVAAPGTTDRIDVRAQDPTGPFGAGMLRLLDGRLPTQADEVALTDGVARILDARIGSSTDLGDGRGRHVRVVGRVENPGDLRDEFALTAPGAAPDAERLTILLDEHRRRQPPPDEGGAGGRANQTGAPDGTGTGAGAGNTDVDFAVVGVSDSRASVVALVVMATTVAMLLVALVATAGFLVVGQRRQRQLGLLAALGATERHQRLVLLTNGALVGAVASLLGTAVGLAVWLGAAPAVEQAAHHRIGRLDLPWTVILECAGLGLVASTAAAGWPARSLARRPIVAALSRRPARPAPVHRSAVGSLVLVGGGVAGMFASGIDRTDVKPVVLMGALAAVVLGVVLAAPSAIRAATKPASRLPLTARLALRDLGRHQSRAAAALAAITLAVGLCVAVTLAANASEYRSDEGNLSDRQLIVRAHADGDDAMAPDAAVDDRRQPSLDAAAKAVGDAVGATTRVALDVAVPARPDPNGSRATTAGRHPLTVARRLGGSSYRFVAAAYVASDDVLEALHVDPHDLDPTADLVTDDEPADGLVLLDPSVRPDDESAPKVQRLDLPAHESAPHALIPPGAMTRHGWDAVRAGWLLETDRPLTTEQRGAAARAAAGAGLTVEVRSTQDDLAAIRTVATGVALLLALAVVSMTVGLIRSESAGDLRTLTATGAEPSVRRALTANTAVALAGLGVVLGTAGAYVVLASAYHAALDRLGRPPLLELATIAVGTPLLAALVGWVAAGREPRTFARAAVD